MGQGRQRRQGNRKYATSEISFRQRLNHKCGEHDWAYMRLDKKTHSDTPLAHPPAASERRALAAFFNKLFSRVLCALYYFFFFVSYIWSGGSVLSIPIVHMWSKSFPPVPTCNYLVKRIWWRQVKKRKEMRLIRTSALKTHGSKGEAALSQKKLIRSNLWKV